MKLLDQAKADLQSVIKLGAGGANDAAADATMAAGKIFLKQILTPVAAALLGAGTTGGLAYYFAKKDRARHEDDLDASVKTLAAKSTKFSTEPEKFLERFNELALISPTIAKSPNLAVKLIDSKINSGFNVDDIHKLTAIEHNASTSRGYRSPGAAGRAGASSALGTIMQSFGPSLLPYYAEKRKDYQNAIANINKDTEDRVRSTADRLASKYSLNKESSMKTASDECLGTMLAERFVLLKTAGVGDMFALGAKNLASVVPYYASAIALGGGVELVRHVMENRRNTALSAQADKNFKMIMRDSDSAKGNKEIAQEAFDTLKAVAPSLAARPLVAKTFIEYVSAHGQIAPETIQQLAEAENKVRGIGGDGGKGFFTGIKSTMDIMKPKEVENMHNHLRDYGRPKKG